MKNRIKGLVLERGFLWTLALSLFALVFFFGKLLVHPNGTYFGANGDGFQSYFTALYHVKHDASLWHMDGMNYPYGEQVFFTGCQPLVTNAIKLVSHVIDISGYTLAILNLLMLGSIVLCALSIYLIFKELKLQYLYAAIAATAIAFLSPQIDRLGGHYSLTYQFGIPLFLYLLMKFYQRPSLKRSLLIAALVLFMAGAHFYFFGFFALIALFYWAGLFLLREGQFKRIGFVIKHGFVQIVLPFAILQIIMMLTNTATDRTAFPSGYLGYKANLAGVFYPTIRFYTPFFNSFIQPEFPEWEGFSYIGLVGVLASVILVLYFVKHLYKREFRRLFFVAENTLLSLFFWAALFSLALSFGLPFAIKGYEYLLYYAGPLKQLRGIGRFAWNYYYIINIIGFYLLHRFVVNHRSMLGLPAAAAALYIVSYDAYVQCYGREDHLNNRLEVLQDKKFELPENQWLKGLQTSEYQGIISLPYFNWGSENVWATTESPIIQDVFITCLQTGLPTVNLISSRVSLSQTYKNMAIIKEPYRNPEIVKELPNTKPFLVLVRPNDLGREEKLLLSLCKKITGTPRFEVYSLSTEALAHKADRLFDETSTALSRETTFAQREYRSSDSLENFVIKNYEDMPNAAAYDGKGCWEGKLKDYNQLYKGSIPNWKDTTYVVSFWMDDFTTDLYPRAVIELAFLDSAGNVYGSDYYNPGKNYAALDGKWGLVEREFRLKHANDQVQVTLWHPEIPDEKLMFRADNLLIRPVYSRLYWGQNEKKITLNNRTYLKQ